eukprot:10932867-Alexandrium_andersonii.AAC.1
MRKQGGGEINVCLLGTQLVTLLRHDPQREVRYKMDTTGWVLAQDCMTMDVMSRYGPLSDEALRILVELENEEKIRFLMAWGSDGRLYLRAAQAHSGGLGAFIDM